MKQVTHEAKRLESPHNRSGIVCLFLRVGVYFSPSSVSTLRGSYARCKGRCEVLFPSSVSTLRGSYGFTVRVKAGA